MRANPELSGLSLLKQSRLSVCPVTTTSGSGSVKWQVFLPEDSSNSTFSRSRLPSVTGHLQKFTAHALQSGRHPLACKLCSSRFRRAGLNHARSVHWGRGKLSHRASMPARFGVILRSSIRAGCAAIVSNWRSLISQGAGGSPMYAQRLRTGAARAARPGVRRHSPRRLDLRALSTSLTSRCWRLRRRRLRYSSPRNATIRSGRTRYCAPARGASCRQATASRF